MSLRATALAVVMCALIAPASGSGNNHALIVQAFDAAQSDFSVPDTSLYKAFWNDPYLLYEMLNTTQYGHRFSLSPIPHERIHLLYADGEDYAGRTWRYKPLDRLGIPKATDAPATLDTVCRYLEAFAHGDQSLGIERMTWSDTLVVYLFGHGDHNRHPPNRHPDPSKATHFCLKVRQSGGSGYTELWDTTFGRLLNSVRAQKVVILQQCYGGGFIDDIADSTTTVISASTSSQRAWSVDEDDRWDSPLPECDSAGSAVEGHSEFSFHLFNALRGAVIRPDLWPSQHPRRADFNGDSAVSWYEAYLYAERSDSRSEDPVFFERTRTWAYAQPVPIDSRALKVHRGGGIAAFSRYDSTRQAADWTLYAMKGNKSHGLWSYSMSDSIWTELESLPVSGPLKKGTCIAASDEGDVYVARGGKWREFWRYAASSDSWQRAADVPVGPKPTVKHGSCLTAVASPDGETSYVYLLKAMSSGRNGFYRFNAHTGQWSTMQPPPPSGSSSNPRFKAGSSMCWDGEDTIYVLKGSAKPPTIYGYSIAADSWSLVAGDFPVGGVKPKDGSGIARLPGGSLYMLVGKTRQVWVFDRHAPAGQRWSPMESLPAGPSGNPVAKNGSGMVAADNFVWVLRGAKTNDVLRLTPRGDRFSPAQGQDPPTSPGEVCLVSGGEPAEPRFSHHGELVAFTRSDGDSGPRQVWVAPVSGDDPKQLTKLAGDCAWPVWSPNDALVAFEYEPGGGQPSQVRIVPVSGSSTTTQLGNANWSHHRPSWTPGGGSLVCEVEDSTGYSQVYLIDAATGGEGALTRDHADHTQVTAAGSGHVVYLGADSAGNGQVYALKPGDSVAVQWTGFALDRDNLSVSESDSTVVFEVESDDGYVRIGRVVGSAGEDTLTSGAADQLSPAVGPDFGVAFCTETTDDGDALCIVTSSGTQALTGDQATREQLHVGPLNEDAEYPIAYVRDDGLYVFTPSGSGGGGMAGSGTLLRLSAEAANPVRGRLVIRWQTPVEQHVRLRVYNTAGQVARTLHDARTPVGVHMSNWDCTDAQGRRLPAGVYFYALETESRRISRKVVISSK